MLRYLLPLVLVGASIALFVTFIDPNYQGPGGIKELEAQKTAYDDALNKSNQLRARLDFLRKRFNAITPEQKEKLQAVVPDNVDNIRLVIDINNIASRNNLAIKNLSVGQTQSSKAPRSAAAVGASGSPVGSVDLTFTVASDYAHFLAFLEDLQRSLRIVDIERISFSVSETGVSDYNLTIRTYWLH